jgi:A/G-specific adenine glycosylase
MRFSQARLRAFRKKIHTYYRSHPRTFPWRPPSLKLRKDKTVDSYHILISEIMLQQTQVDRVIPYYLNFLASFPSFSALARAPLQKVLTAWSGLGYNRRALFLKRIAEEVVKKYKGKLPHTYDELINLPGIGPATAAAVCAFAWNLPSLYLDTNVRTVFLHEFFQKRKKTSDKQILPLLQITLDHKNSREWYYALLDYGAMIKKTEGNPNARSTQYTRQTAFKGSLRELRGNILKLLISRKKMSRSEIFRTYAADTRVPALLQTLEREGFLKDTFGQVSLR